MLSRSGVLLRLLAPAAPVSPVPRDQGRRILVSVESGVGAGQVRFEVAC
ncbi:hypothetical protein [Cutibacterium granulosum]|nr:hypothetical protein [Cutibacterium granulosum]MEA5637524.1 hypothetical protein [Cutibacterium granulosum]MEA5642164.1 hypothetical protein [Cutibacterium granulosum]